jgi:hypothetical protein
MPALRILQVEHMEKRRIQQRFYLFSGDGRSFHFFTIPLFQFFRTRRAAAWETDTFRML